MVWIHGGGYSMGSATNDGLCDGTALAAIGDVIVVCLNYRLFALGFFSTGDENAPGNYGLLDQLAALKWVQDNIAAFGGDADRVTIFGGSAGAASVDYLLLSPMSDGLFHRAILQSGTASLASGARENVATLSRVAHGVGQLLGCEEDNSEDLVQCLRSVPAEHFREKLDQSFLATIPGIEPEIVALPFEPVVDGHFITAKPDHLLSQGGFNKTNVDILIGTTANEGTLFLSSLLPTLAVASEPTVSKAEYEQVYLLLLFGSFKHNPTAQDAIQLMYIPWADVAANDTNYAEAYIEMQGDYMFVCPADKSARAYSNSGANVYMYHMTHAPANPLYGIQWAAAGHAEELPFVFGTHFNALSNWPLAQEEVNMSLSIMTYWTNMAKTGNPNLSGDEAEMSEDDWPKFAVPGLAYKELSLEMKNNRALKSRECALWNDFIPKLVNRIEDEDFTPTEEDMDRKTGRSLSRQKLLKGEDGPTGRHHDRREQDCFAYLEGRHGQRKRRVAEYDEVFRMFLYGPGSG
ncbi:acetylcholinesterase-like [Ptychodera flava]|uniref:acetylcholinesterase-like n=1 Tax=Ptychodera flava TaxID=63121 RepID=UPI003969D8E9